MNETIQSVQTLESADTARPPASSRPPTADVRRGGILVGLFAWVMHTIPTLLILLALSGLAVWGHHTGWKMPSFAELNGQAKEETSDWCVSHGVPDKNCAICVKGCMTKPKTYGWCPVHGVHDCPLEHADVAQLPSVPTISQTDLDRAKRALDFAKRPENNSRCKLHPNIVQAASQEVIEKLGLKLEPVWTGPVEEVVSANGELGYDQTKIASLSSFLPGRVFRVDKQVGDMVKKGDVLALIDASQVGKAKAEFLQSLAELDFRKKNQMRLKSLGSSVIAESQILEAEALLLKAEADYLGDQQALVNLGIPADAEELKTLPLAELNRQMRLLGLPDSVVRTLDANATTGNLIAVRAPLDGLVVERKVVEGEMVDSSKPLFVVADTRTLWLTLHVNVDDARSVKLGQAVRFRHQGGDQEVTGKVTWISSAVDEKTRTVEVRADAANPDGRLRANTFGAGTIVLRQEDNAIVVPNVAVHWDGNCHTVFVQDKDFHKTGHPKVFHVRNVRPGAITGQQTEIIAGVLPGEVVVAEGSGVLRSQLLKNNLGAG